MSFLTFLDYVIVVVPSIFLTSRISESLIYSAVIICALYAFRLYDYTENLINSLTRSLFGVAFGSIFLFVICKLFRSSFFSIKVFFMFLALVFVFPIVNYALCKLVSKTSLLTFKLSARKDTDGICFPDRLERQPNFL